MAGVKKSAFKAGMYLLETLTSGMYNDPLIIYREYIQNAVDSIDLAKNKDSLLVKIDIDSTNKKITFWDNGVGIPSTIAQKTLSAIGSSNKINKGLRGFRGIGRLGGLAFCEKATFRTKALNEKVESVQEWDCAELRRMLSSEKKTSVSLKKLFDNCTSFNQINSKKASNSYFQVELEEVSSFRNYIFDLKRVYDYLGKIAPVQFDPNEFEYGTEISEYLESNLDNYSAYNLVLNGHPVYKQYRDRVKVTKKGYDQINQIEFVEIKSEQLLLAYGWYGIREDLLGAIAKGEKSSGIRVRLGNILIGDEHLLDECFREPRFNSYLMGELHIADPKLIPNSRRDDFIDNDKKTLFYNSIAREIGLPLSKEIRNRSRLYSENKHNPNRDFALKPKIKLTDRKISIEQLKCVLKNHCENCPNLNEVLVDLKINY